MRNLSNLMEMKEKKKMKVGSATSMVKDVVGWKNPPRDWEPWVRKLSCIHQSTWKNAGIYEAVMSSIYPIKRHGDLILELASRWCSKTNTFVFPWGDATLTLEDMSILGGFSVSGASALSSLENDVESLKINQELELARKEIQKGERKARHARWIKKFIGSGNGLEHAAFLSVWLSRFVFPAGSSSSVIVNKHVFPIAARLLRGIKIALGPLVLATIYTRLTALTKIQLGDNVGPIDLRAPFHLVQIWAWERFPMLKPVPDYVFSGDNFPRLARWSKVKILKNKDLKSAIDSSEKSFLWCPYGAFAKRAEKDPESFALCMKTSEIVGFDSCIERYEPQYVTRQFGLDQDIPCDKVDKMTNFKNTNACVFQPSISTLYEKWRKQRRSSTISEVKVEVEADYGPPPGFPPKIEVPCVVISDSDSDFDSDSDSDSDDGSKLKDGATEVVNGSVHETKEDEGKVADAKPDNESLGLDLEARISRLEDIVYAHIKALEAGSSN